MYPKSSSLKMCETVGQAKAAEDAAPQALETHASEVLSQTDTFMFSILGHSMTTGNMSALCVLS